MDGDEIGPFNVGNPGEFTMLELANVRWGVLLGWGAPRCAALGPAEGVRVCVCVLGG